MQWNKHIAPLILVPLLALGQSATAQTLLTAHSARNSAMGGCLSADDTAGHVRLSYRQAYLLPELADKTLTMALPTGHIGRIEAGYTHHGNTDYFEHLAEAAYSLRVTGWLWAGIAAHYLHIGTSDPHYEHQQWISATGGLHADVGQRLRMSVIAGSCPGTDTHRYRILFQGAYHPTPQLLTVIEADYQALWRIRFGMEYNYSGSVYVRAGMATNPITAAVGLGLRYRSYSFDLGAELHNTLGLTPSTSLTLWF